MRHKLLLFNLIFIFLLGFSLQSCKKDPKTDVEDNTPPAGGTRAQLTLDSIFLYAKQIYLWNDQLPSYKEFEPRQYSSPSRELFALTQIPTNPETGLPYEATDGSSPKYSNITNEGDSEGFFAFKKTSEVSLEGDGFDFGIAWANVGNQYLVLRAVETNSPAYKAGLQRGDVIEEINDRAVNLSTEAGIDRVNDALFMARLKLEGKKKGGTPFSVTIEQQSYTNNPIYKKRVINVGSKKVGYLAYARFSELESNSQAVLNQAFREFAVAGISDLVVDLRYNGGGYVTTAEYLTNLIAPTSLNGKVMFIEHYNDLMSSGKADILKNQFFEFNGENVSYSKLNFSEAANTSNFDKEKEKDLKDIINNIQSVYFIVSGQTASASELVINSLKAHMNVKVIGKTTYGKPVGFFPIYIDSYEIYLANFETRNANNQGGYYSGLQPTPGYEEDDDVTSDFGDPEESCLARALSDLGGSSAIAAKQMSIKGRAVAPNIKIQPLGTDREFKGMIQDKFRRRSQN